MIFAGDGVEALDVLNSTNKLPDVIFLDYNMPRMNGMDCLKALKADKRLKNIPTIMYTTSGDREHEKVILRLGADHYMQKTNSFLELCKELERLMDMIDRKVTKQRLQRF